MFQGNMNRPGDWNCRECQHLNFQRRDSCQRCGEPRHGSIGNLDFGFRGGAGLLPSSLGFTNIGPDVRPGDWYCNIGNCGTHNFASRFSCFKCGAFKDDSGMGGFESSGSSGGDISRGRSFGMIGGGSGTSTGAGRSAWKSGDWICNRLGCNEHNFASRMECFRCNAPREPGTKSPY